MRAIFADRYTARAPRPTGTSGCGIEHGVKRSEEAFEQCGGKRSQRAREARGEVDESGRGSAKPAARIGGCRPQHRQRQVVRSAGQSEEGDRGLGGVTVDSGRISDRSEQKTTHADSAPADSHASRAARDPVGDHTAHEATDRSGRERQRRKDARSLQRQTMFPHEVRRQPRHEELESESGSEVAAKQRDHRRIEQQALPRQRAPCLRRRRGSMRIIRSSSALTDG